MKKLTATLVFFSILTTLEAQMGSLSLSFGAPQNEFKESTDAIGFGGDLSLAFPFQKGIPIYLGFDLNYMVYGLNTRDEELFAQVTLANGTPIGDPIIIPLQIVNTSSLLGIHAFLRAVAPLNRIQPYAEALIGFRYLSTTVKIRDMSPDNRWSGDPEDDIIVRETVLDDWVVSYGYGGGFLIRLKEGMFLDLRANFYKGQRAKYFDGEDTQYWTVEFSGDPNAFDSSTVRGNDLSFGTQARESRTDLLEVKMGIAFKI